MQKVAVIIVVVLFGVFVWSVGSRLSADAVGMAVGVVFGVMAGIPMALLVLASGRRRAERDEYEPSQERGRLLQGGYPYPAYPQHPPVIVLAAPSAPQMPMAPTVDSFGYPARPALPGPGAHSQPGARAFKVVGEKEEWLEEW